MLKGTKLYSIFNNKCPKCHQGDFFVNSNPYKSGFVEMHSKCSHCSEPFVKEVGFYYGAMYVSYGVNITIGITTFLLMVLLLGTELITYLVTYSILTCFLFPWTMRISRLIYINLFVKFDSTKK